MNADDELDLILAGDDTFIASDDTASTVFMEHDQVSGDSAAAAGVVLGVGYVLLRASRFPNLAMGQEVMVNETTYSVQQIMRVQDGKPIQVFLGDA